MPLFSSRKRAGSSNPPVDRSTSSSAAIAASSAFLQRPQSSASLSSAAAAAALRSLTATPEPVGSIQTKRMVRRGSVSSVGSGSIMGSSVRGGGMGRGVLQRTNSGGSMSERTFRSPSPGRSNGVASPQPDLSKAPPVPAIPRNIPSGHYRSASVEPSQRIMSPVRGGRGASVDRAGTQSARQSRIVNKIASTGGELERTDSNRNVNFSRPMSPPVSPISEQKTIRSGRWFSGVTGGNPATKQSDPKTAKIERIQAAAGQPVSNNIAATSAQGSHLAQAREDGGQVVSYETTDTIMVFDPNTRTFIAKPGAKPKPAQPTAPALPPPQPLAPGAYDPSTRTIVPKPGSSLPQAATVDDLLSQRSQDLQPPPRNPARNSPMGSPTAPRFQLHKQPSVVREDPQAEEEASAADAAGMRKTGKTISTSVGTVKSYVAPSISHQRSSSLDVPRGAAVGVGRGRNVSASISPSRSARFSASPVVQATRHDPPPRDISPVKSALKHSPSSSIRAISPLAGISPNGLKSPPSEASDTTSITSQDGVAPGKKRRSVRVSFDEQPHEIDPEHAIATPTAISRDRGIFDDHGEDDEVMKPRPALPSFGSVRKNRVTSAVAEKVTEMPPARNEVSSDHAIAGILSNANEGVTKSKVDSEPPEVTSKEAAGYNSDEGDVAGDATPSKQARQADDPTAVESQHSANTVVALPDPSNKESLAVPDISLQPPTPGQEEEEKIIGDEGKAATKRESFTDGVVVPGGWAKEDENEAGLSSTGAAAATVATIEANQPGSAPTTDKPSPILDAINEDSDDGDAFSDAAQDPSEIENEPFASLDAIAISPLSAPKPVVNVGKTSPPESPTSRQGQKGGVNVAPTVLQADDNGDWTEATAYWSKLSRQQREQIEREHFSSDDEGLPPQEAAKKPKKSALKKTNGSASAPVTAQPSKYAVPAANAQPAQPAMRKSLRAQSGPVAAPADGEVHMRRSMRTGGAGGMATSLRDGPRQRPQSAIEQRGALQKKSARPVSSSALSNTTLPASAIAAAMLQRQRDEDAQTQDSAYPRVQSRNAPQATSAMSTKLQKELTHDSDSDTSFKKKRRGSISTVDSSGKYNMKRSMRGGSVDRHATPDRRQLSPTPSRGNDSFSIRSLSPTGFLKRNRGDQIRESLRGNSADTGARMTLRGPASKANNTKSGRPAVPAQQARSSRFKSRFVDSDDEDEDTRPPRGFFKSRFADSDDEDDEAGYMPANLAPVRGIPRRAGQQDGDSTDLEDSEEEKDARKASRRRAKQSIPLVPDSTDIDKAMEAARKKLGIPAEGTQPKANDTSTTQGVALTQGSLRLKSDQAQPEQKSKPEDLAASVNGNTPKRKGFMGSILRRNRNSATSVPTVQTQSPTSPVSPTAPVLPPVDPTTPFATTPVAGTPLAATPLAATPLATTPLAEPASSPFTPTPPAKLRRRLSAQPAPPRLQRGDSMLSNATAPPAVGDRSDWPLPPPVPKLPAGLQDERPNTSDDAVWLSERASVRFQDGGEPGGDNRVIYSSRTGKKKRFGLLRRAFGLND